MNSRILYFFGWSKERGYHGRRQNFNNEGKGFSWERCSAIKLGEWRIFEGSLRVAVYPVNQKGSGDKNTRPGHKVFR